MKLKLVATAAVMATALLASGHARAQEKLTIWWEKGFYKAEDDALFAVIKRFEDKFKVKVDLSLYATQEVIPKMVAALDSGNPPNVGFDNVLDFQVTAKWAYDDKLEDISSVIDPMRAQFEPAALSTTFLYDNVKQSRAYYAFPVKQQTMHIQYWKDMLADAGYKESDIPKEWDAYWDFWCTKVQDGYRKKTGQRAFGIGVPMGVDSSDSFYSFLTFMDAYSWKDPDNNVAFHNKTTVLTHNATISIVAKWLDDMNNQALTAEQRATAKKNYSELIATSGFPNKPDGSKMIYRAAVKTGVVFKDAKNKAGAKKFVSFLLEDANLTPYVEGSLGRWFPITKKAQQSPFWKADPARTAVYNQFMNGTTPFEFTKNYKFTVLNNENVWAKAMNRIISDKVPVDKAVDELIARIKTVAGS